MGIDENHDSEGAADGYVAHFHSRIAAVLVFIVAFGSQQSRAFAESPLHIELDANKRPDIRIGLLGGLNGLETGRSRNGAWAPVYVKLKAGKEGVARESIRLVVESTDSEDSPYRYITAIPNLAANEDYVAISYIRPGSGGSEFKVSLETTAGVVVQTVPVIRDTGKEMLGPRDQLFLAIGSRLPGLARALKPEPKGDEPPANDEDEEDRGARRVAFVDSVAMMPDRWFGYDAVDVVFLTTGSGSFVQQLLEAPEAASRRKALAEWVRRGGKLVVSVGHNHQLAAAVLQQMPLPDVDRMPLVDCTIGAGAIRKRMERTSIWARPMYRRLNEAMRDMENVEVAGLTPGHDLYTIIMEKPERAGDNRDRPILVQGSCGLGRVVLVAFDLDTQPFTTWIGQSAFWNQLLSEFAPRSEPAKSNVEPRELGTELRRTLETFPTVKPVSFGWVALFILIYIVLVGPLDYLILKKVFKRLELTWITFPIVVLTVSVAAYFTAYALKGEDLLVNKVDLVEIDLHAPQIYGQTWFTLFSPRIQNYTVGLEPAWPNSSTMIAALDDPIRANRSGSQGIFSRPYVYANDASGIERVPIPVWATRTFSASWRAAPTGELPIVAEITHSQADPLLLSGTITNNLPFNLQDVALFYHNKWHSVGILPSGGFHRVDNDQLGGPRGQELDRWLGSTARVGSDLKFDMVNWLLRPMLFHRHERQAAGLFNSYCRHLDQTWRLVPQPGSADRYRDEVILVGRLSMKPGRAEDLTSDAAMPSRLWLGELPAAGATRPALSGRMEQEIIVRAYIPVTPRPQAPPP